MKGSGISRLNDSMTRYENQRERNKVSHEKEENRKREPKEKERN